VSARRYTHRLRFLATTLRSLFCILLCLILGEVQAENAIRRSSTGEPQTLDPQLWIYGQDGNIAHDLFQGLTAVNAAAVTVPGQAESWSVSPDGRVYTFKLRSNLKWSDGKPITSADFIYSLRRLFNPATAAPSASLLYVIKNAREVNAGRKPVESLGIRAPDAQTVIIELEHPAPFFTEILVHRAFPVPRHVIERWGREWTRAEHMVSNGAFTLGEWRPGSHVKLLRNPLFIDAPMTKLNAIYHIPVEDPNAALTRYRAGDLDIVVSVPSDKIAELKRDFGPQLHLTQQIGFEYLAFNTRRGPTADARVRRALSMAIDRQVITNKVLRAGERPSFCIVPPGVLYYPQPGCADFADWTPMVRFKQAQALLKSAGYSLEKPLRLRYRINNTDTQKRIALAVTSMWQPLGVRTEIIGSDMKSHQQAITQADFDIARGAWYAEDRDAMSFLRLLDVRSVALNISGYSNGAYQSLLKDADESENLIARANYMSQAETQAMRDQPIAPIFVYVSRRLISPRVLGWVDNPRGVNISRYLAVDSTMGASASTSSIHSPAAPLSIPARRP